MTAGKNRHTPYFKSLTPYVYLPEFHAQEFRYEEAVYRTLLDTYPNDELYLIFYFTWLTALWENACRADIILSIDLLGSDKKYAERAAAALKRNNITNIDFSDVRPHSYPEYKLPPRRMAEIEKSVRSIIFHARGSKERDLFLSKLSREEKKNFDLSAKSFSPGKTAVFKTQDEDERVKKLESLLDRFLHIYVRELEEKVKTGQLQQSLGRIKNSYSYRVGRLVLSPFRMIKKVKSRFTRKSK